MADRATKPKAEIITEEGEETVDLAVTGVDSDALKTKDYNSHLLEEILLEQKITNQYLFKIVGQTNEVVESDIETKK